VFTPKWCIAHAVALVAVLVMLRLGLWQWDRAESPTGGVQNYAYALQWPLFAVFAIVVYVKTLREEAHREPGTPRGAMPRAHTGTSGVLRQPGLRVGITTRMVEIDEDDDEMRAYNARLARLNAASAAVESRAVRAR
jgi:DNA-binding transcriptional regulator of glucitol operon